MRSRESLQEHLDDWVWGPITKVHTVGPYAIVEFQHNKPSNAEPGWRPSPSFHPIIHLDRRGVDWYDTGISYDSLDRALVAAIAWKYEDREDDDHQHSSVAANSQAVKYFMRMIGAS